ncbi:DeoR/GlpR transcriptional regulator [Opitutaceae bacterium TAV4]|nr:DeoR/GlpR transcriptional regulator [Opitutaceae bacterium TAV4]RRK02496.1 DeoR/GlpR transcriptional regulator [Opitutaceae bacterium TAV3]
MFAHERHQTILDTLQKRSPLTVPELEKILNASPATVRRDLTFLEKIGKIIRTHGGVLHPDHVQGEISFDRKSRAALNAKIALATEAAALAKAGDTVFVDAGTTTLEVGRRLLEIDGLTIFTNSIPLLNERSGGAGRAGARLVALGGEVRSVSLALVGSGALEWVNRIRPDIAFLGASGIDATGGPCTTELFEAEVKSAVIARASRSVLLADASKWEKTAAIRYADWSQVHDVFTNRTPDKSIRIRLAQNNVKLHVVTK